MAVHVDGELNKETQEVLDAVLRGEGLHGPYNSVEEMMEEILRG